MEDRSTHFLQSQNDLVLIEHLKRQIEEKKDIITKMNDEMEKLESQVKLTEENENKLSKRVLDLTTKLNKLMK